MKYKHLTLDDRVKIENLLSKGKSYQKIAKSIGKTKSTISYEVNRKSCGGSYNAKLAQEITEIKRNSVNSLRSKYTNQGLMDELEFQLKRKRSPKDIASRFKEKFPQNKQMQISHETIYKIIFSFKNTNIFEKLANLYKYLPRKNKKKNIRGHLNPYRAYKRYWRSIHRMPNGLKENFGVWQIDAMHITGGYILVCVEVVSKRVMSMPLKYLTADACLEALKLMFSRVENIKALICDRGSENTKFKEIQRVLNTRVYACDPGCPWQKGLVEGTIRLLRRHFPNNYKL